MTHLAASDLTGTSAAFPAAPARRSLDLSEVCLAPEAGLTPLAASAAAAAAAACWAVKRQSFSKKNWHSSRDIYERIIILLFLLNCFMSK